MRIIYIFLWNWGFRVDGGPKKEQKWDQKHEIAVNSSYEVTKAMKINQMVYNLEIYF